MKDKKIIIFGAAGSIGSELYRQLAPRNTVLAVDINETDLFDLHEENAQKGYAVSFRIGDVRDRQTVAEVFEQMPVPDLVFHCAALKHVYPNELFPVEAVKTNVLGTLNVIQEAKRLGVKKLVYISTDKVINSYSVMGVSKKLGELIARNAGYVAVRFGNVLGSRGSVLPIWEKQVARGEPITLTDVKAERYFMSIQEACELVIEAATVGEPGQTLVMDMGEKKNMYEFAKQFLRERGLSEDKITLIGLRKGETLSEEIMTSEEQKSAIKKGKFYII